MFSWALIGAVRPSACQTVYSAVVLCDYDDDGNDDDDVIFEEDYQHDVGEDDQHDVMSFTIKKRCQRGHSDIARMAYCQEMMISNDIHVVDDTVRSLFDVMVMMR